MSKNVITPHISNETKRALTAALHELGEITCNTELLHQSTQVDFENIGLYKDDTMRVKKAEQVLLDALNEYQESIDYSELLEKYDPMFPETESVGFKPEPESYHLIQVALAKTKKFSDRLFNFNNA